ncbi:nucleoid occlusion protein [Lacticaseibacillus zeae DSM 20178 = KCTC 3804]|uniref:Nucleoid occlusion protein n=2 Tax=Lacticaseibacillus zeae TaxID=57037 RepID=A0A5R8LRG9_LACZE|nr:nucleoid occlusion protein [Lacticaseibacillus zeae]KRK10641.1 nucleoid occlusion protein [Lacticaseibacillus zeae DSM 20178 = KCTC 3804]OLS11436.1 nucleoid occlusion protein [Lacticaseibacillus casei]QVI32263.1 nucleoid occlusion protein [Lacticaseibacillus zeae]TLF39805.1 nucleoid occlusion protein [Lacticaseibacillus zeae]
MALSFFGHKKPNDETVVQQLPLNAITPNQFQPRKVFSADSIQELAATIKEHGLLQPIIVREYAPDQYEIIAGERRYRAMQLLGWEKAPAIVQKMDDDESASMALVENLQREGLSAIEEGQAYVALMKLNQLTQGALAQQLGKSQAFVANKIRLLKLDAPVQEAIMKGLISERHGRELLKLSDDQQAQALHQIVADKLTVKETAALVNEWLRPKKPEKKPKPKVRRSAVSHDTRVAWNTLKRSVKMIRDTGMTVTAKEEDTDDAYRMIIEIPKEKR